MQYHKRVMINPGMFIEEGTDIMLLTNENLEEITTYYDDKLVESMKELVECRESYLNDGRNLIELVNKNNERIKELEEENQKLKLLNNELTLNIIELKEARR